MIKKICIIGYGVITQNIIKNLLENSEIDINVWSRTRKFSEGRVNCSDDIEKLIVGTDLILSCVPNDEASDQAWHNPVVKEYIIKEPVYCLEMSTLSIKFINEWHRYITEINGHPIESPLTKSRRINSNKSISAFVFSEYYNSEVATFMNIFCNKIYCFKEKCEPTKFKLIYNTWGAEMLYQLSEMYKVIENEFKNKDMVWDIFSNDGWMSLICKTMISKVHGNDNSVSFKLKYMKKDVDYSEDIFIGYDSNMYRITKAKYDAFVNDSNENEDFSIIIDR